MAVAECLGDLAQTQRTFLLPLHETLDQKYPKLATIRECAATSMKRDGLLEERHWEVSKNSGIKLAIF